MEELRNDEGFIELDENMVTKRYSMTLFDFLYKQKKYIVKIRDYSNCYNELIAEELAKDYGIKCAHYDIGVYGFNFCVISEDFIGDNEFIKMYDILKLINSNPDFNNNLEDIWAALCEFRKINSKLEVYNIMNKVVDIFIFDILIANVDRHTSNYGLLISDGKIDISPIYDNEALLYPDSINNSTFFLNVDSSNKNDVINYFLKISSKEYYDKIKEKLWIISEENIEKVFERIEKRTKSKIDVSLKSEILEKFNINREKLENIINKSKVKRKE